jgi:hypothetical protein
MTPCDREQMAAVVKVMDSYLARVVVEVLCPEDFASVRQPDR